MRAENGTQTRDPQLGRLVLYRLSYFRKVWGEQDSCGESRIRTYEDASQLSYSQPQLATLVSPHHSMNTRFIEKAGAKISLLPLFAKETRVFFEKNHSSKSEIIIEAKRSEAPAQPIL